MTTKHSSYWWNQATINTKKRTGLVRSDGKAVRDDTGYFHPVGTTFMWALHGEKYEPTRYDQNLAYIAGKFDYIRMLGQVDWSGNNIDPNWPDYQTVLANAIDRAYDKYGIRTELTIIGKGAGLNYADIAAKVRDVVIERQHKIMDIEMVNESTVPPNTVTLNTMWSMYNILRNGGVHNLMALSNVEGIGSQGIELNTSHISRGEGDNKWRQVRQGWDFKDIHTVVSSNEPPGFNSSVGTNYSPLQLAMMRALGVMCGGAMYVLHTGDMVGGVNDPTRNRHANIWEVVDQNGNHAPFEQAVEAIRMTDAWLPDKVENWTRANTGWTPPNPVTAYQPDAYWPGSNHGINKAYGASSGNNFMQMLCGVLDHVTMTGTGGQAHAFNGLRVETGMKQNYGRIDNFTFPGRQDTMTGYILLGTL